jgi:hypothetical protein
MNDNQKPGENKSTPQQRKEQHSKMAVPADSAPGSEFDAHGNLIPFQQRTSTDQAKAKAAPQK